MYQNCSISFSVDLGGAKKQVRTFGPPPGIIMTCRVIATKIIINQLVFGQVAVPQRLPISVFYNHLQNSPLPPYPL